MRWADEVGGSLADYRYLPDVQLPVQPDVQPDAQPVVEPDDQPQPVVEPDDQPDPQADVHPPRVMDTEELRHFMFGGGWQSFLSATAAREPWHAEGLLLSSTPNPHGYRRTRFIANTNTRPSRSRHPKLLYSKEPRKEVLTKVF